MEQENDRFLLSDEKLQTIQDLLKENQRDVPAFTDEGICEEFYVPVKDGELRVFNHKPEKIEVKRPILFLPGFTANPLTWVDFHKTHQGFAEYFYIESREKNSSRLKKSKETSFTVDQCAQDLRDVIKYLGFANRDYVLHGSSYGGAIVLQSLIRRYINPPTAIVFDPIALWVYGGPIIHAIIQIIPPNILGKLRLLITRIALRSMKNKEQKKRMIEFIKGGDIIKFQRSTKQNRKFNIIDKLQRIDNEVFVFTGPLDKYHPRMAYYSYAKEIPKGRFFFMETEEKQRQLLAGLIATAFSKVSSDEGVPQILLPFEISIDRSKGEK